MKERELRDKGYYRQDKGMYILIHCLVPGLVGGTALFYFFALRKWAKPRQKKWMAQLEIIKEIDTNTNQLIALKIYLNKLYTYILKMISVLDCKHWPIIDY